ncbi:hypothetical protein BC835DRAFT_1313158 [Cytidiella melzeri]|nr:hypothetical protein BC835DRAFT_1313158 [Cytidiella melzeri]
MMYNIQITFWTSGIVSCHLLALLPQASQRRNNQRTPANRAGVRDLRDLTQITASRHALGKRVHHRDEHDEQLRIDRD